MRQGEVKGGTVTIDVCGKETCQTESLDQQNIPHGFITSSSQTADRNTNNTLIVCVAS